MSLIQAILIGLMSCTAVSYTHLDVYKRQVCIYQKLLKYCEKSGKFV